MNNHSVTELRNALALRRRELGMSQRELAVRMGTSQSAVSDLEQTNADAQLSTWIKWANALGYTFSIKLLEVVVDNDAVS